MSKLVLKQSYKAMSGRPNWVLYLCRVCFLSRSSSCVFYDVLQNVHCYVGVRYCELIRHYFR